MEKILIFTLVLFIRVALYGQDSVEMRLKPRMKIEEVIPFNKMYVYPQFTEGIVGLANGTFANSLLSYNLLLQEMQFLNNEGDTLALIEESGVKFVVVKTDTFLYNHGYYQLIRSFNSIKIAKKENLHVADIHKKGGYNLSFPVGAIDTYTNQFGATGYKLILNQDVIFAKGKRYYVSVDGRDFVPALKRNILKQFPEKYSDKIQNYIREQKIEFNKEEDLLALGKFLSQL